MELFKNGCEEVYFRDSEEDNCITERFEVNDKVICFICCEDRPSEHHEVNLDYQEAYWGSQKLNEIFEKYDVYLEWENECIASVYKN